MLRVERAGRRLIGFESFRAKPLGELYGIADFVINSATELMGEIGHELQFLEAGDRRNPADADVLAVDREGSVAVVVVEAQASGS